MALTVQTDDGETAGATSYVSVTDFKAYHTLRGNSLGSYTDANIETALTRATDYLDQRFSFIGYKLAGRSQTTQWPRSDAYDVEDYPVEGIPDEVIEATCEYALRALGATLNPDPDRAGAGMTVKSTTATVGPISESITYADGGVFVMPTYPAADARLSVAGLIKKKQLSVDVSRA